MSSPPTQTALRASNLEQSMDGQVRGVVAVAGRLPIRIERISSSSFTVEWQPVYEASGYEILLSPEPPRIDGRFDKVQLLGKVAAGKTSLRVERLMPDAHVFVGVRALGDDPTVLASGTVHLRMPQPSALPRAGGPVRAYVMAPNLLGLVIRQDDLAFSKGELQGNRGSDWQGGQWEVLRSTGAPLRVTRVHRHSVTAGQGNLPIGFDRHETTTVHIEHRLYLQLQDPIGDRELLGVRHQGVSGTELELLLPFSDQYLETPVLQVNQVGYNPLASRRWAYVYGFLGDGGALALDRFPARALALIEPMDPLARRRPVPGELAIVPSSGRKDDVLGSVHEIDLSKLPAAEGVRYRIHVPGVGVSYPTAVSQQASFKAFYTVLRGLFHNRWCGDLRADLTEWSRPPDHCSAYVVGGRKEGFFPKDTQRRSRRPVRGGHHDAGDFDIRPLHVLVGQSLLRAFELGGPARFSDGQLRIPESGNGIPDLLDEALWSVAAWQQLQEPDGSVRLGVESTRHPPGYYFAHEDKLPYFAYDSTPAHSAYAAGLFAQAAHLVRPYHARRSQELLAAARRAVNHARSQGAPATYLAYAFGEIARAAQDDEARQAFEKAWQAVNVHGRGLFDHLQPAVKIYPGSIYSQHPAMADFVVAYLAGPAVSPAIRTTALSQLQRLADASSVHLLRSPQLHRGARPPGARPDWGMETSQGRYLDGIYQLLQLDRLSESNTQRYFDALSLAADAMLGCNPAGLSYVTGLGTRSPRQPLHLDSIAFQVSRGLPPVPGLPVYGPVETMPGASYYEPLAAAFYPRFEEQPRALRHLDAPHAVNMNEFSVWESQAPAALLFAALLPGGLEPWPALAPGQPEHRSPLPPHTRPGAGSERPGSPTP